uniref:DUF1707 domain-containing protein n=1 Tax=Heterorhabditis bacteriophora TaxID=37862 RepID=A0A1I7WCW3_HETBA
MSPDIQALYDAAQRNTPFSKDVDDALAAHRQTCGERDQIEHARRVDPSDAMPIDPEARRQAYERQRRYAIGAGMTAGLTLGAIAQALGRLGGDGSMSPRKGFLGGRSPAQVQSLLDERVDSARLGPTPGRHPPSREPLCPAAPPGGFRTAG